MNSFSARLPLAGQLGVHIMAPRRAATRGSTGIIRKFNDREALVEFRTSAELPGVESNWPWN